jgi:hypothetical protein
LYFTFFKKNGANNLFDVKLSLVIDNLSKDFIKSKSWSQEQVLDINFQLLGQAEK